MRHRVNLLSTWIDKITLEQASTRIVDFVRSGTAHQIVTVNVDFLRLGNEDTPFRDLINTADLAVPDGMPLVWGARLLGEPLPERVTGVELMLECARLSALNGYSMFLLGAAPGIADEAAAVLQQRYPGVRIAGTYSPPMGPFDEGADAKMVRLIQESKPDMLFVALGAPLQDKWIRAHMDTLGVPVCMGVGGSFDMLAGKVRRAPLWMQRGGLEWLYRFSQEPTRLWRRYFVQDLPVFMRLMAQWQAGNSPTRAMLERLEEPAHGTMEPVIEVAGLRAAARESA